MISKSQVFRYEKNHNSFFTKFFGKNATYYIYCISVSALSVLADMKNVISVFYWYQPIRKLSVLGGILILRRQPRGEGVRKIPILLNKISTKGRRGVKKVQNLVHVKNG